MVTLVTPLVKPVTLWTMRPAVLVIPRTIVAAKSPPGSVGRRTGPEGIEGPAVAGAVVVVVDVPQGR